MAIEIRMPPLSEEMPEGIVLEWRIEAGQRVEKGQVVAEVETDKAVVELEAPAAGALAVQLAQRGQPVPAGGVIGVLAGEGEDVEAVRQRYAGRTAGQTSAAGPARGDDCAPPAGEVLRAIPLHGTRGAVAARMVRSQKQAAQYQVRMDCDADRLLRARGALKKNKQTRNITLNAMILKCVAPVLTQHPMINATIVGDMIYQHAKANIGVAVALANGVVAPVVRDVGGKSLAEVSGELDGLAEAARARELRPEHLRGGTFSVSTLGSYGVHSFTAIIVPPQVAVLAIGAIRDEPVVRDGQCVAGKRIALTLSADHRAVDGAVAAEFLQGLQRVLEDPAALLS